MENVRIWRYPRKNDCIETEELKLLFSFQRPLKIYGGVAQLGEHLPCKQGVKGSIPFISTRAMRFLRKTPSGAPN